MLTRTVVLIKIEIMATSGKETTLDTDMIVIVTLMMITEEGNLDSIQVSEITVTIT